MWEDLAGVSPAFLSNNYLVTDVESGKNYQFKIRALNVHGWGSFSEPVTIKAAYVPAQVDTVTTSVDSFTGGLKVQWVEPDN